MNKEMKSRSHERGHQKTVSKGSIRLYVNMKLHVVTRYGNTSHYHKGSTKITGGQSMYHKVHTSQIVARYPKVSQRVDSRSCHFVNKSFFSGTSEDFA